LYSLAFNEPARFHAFRFGLELQGTHQFTRIAIERLLADPTTPPAMKDWLRLLAAADPGHDRRARFLHARARRQGAMGFDGITMWALHARRARAE
jgi:hypothetical protein